VIGELDRRKKSLERVMGIEPTSSAWEAEVLPLNYTRAFRVVRHGNHSTPEYCRIGSPLPCSVTTSLNQHGF
jgi:hypothetical protein